MISGSKGQKAVLACTIRLLNLGPAKHEEAAIYAVNQRITNILELQHNTHCNETILTEDYMANKNEDYMNEFEEGTVTLSLDDGKEVECGIVAVFPVGEQDYIALLPLNDSDAAEGEVYLYQYFEDADGEPSLGNIEDDEEYERVADAFDELMDEDEYAELLADDDEE